MNIQLKILWVYLIYKGNILFLANLVGTFLSWSIWWWMLDLLRWVEPISKRIFIVPWKFSHHWIWFNFTGKTRTQQGPFTLQFKTSDIVMFECFPWSLWDATLLSFAKGSPFLHRFNLHANILSRLRITVSNTYLYPTLANMIWFLQVSLYSTENPELRRIPISPHKYLKEVLVSGFCGKKLSTDFVMSIFDFAIELEKIEITSFYLGGFTNFLVKQGKADVVGKGIGLLRQRLPAKAQLYFLGDLFFY